MLLSENTIPCRISSSLSDIYIVARVTFTHALTSFARERKTRCLNENTTLFNENDYNSASRLPREESRENLNIPQLP